MLENFEVISPKDIEKRSFEIITGLLGNRIFPHQHEAIIKRVIHTTADFEFADIMNISETAVGQAIQAIQSGCNIVTDTKMAAAGINKKTLGSFGGMVLCYMDDEDIASKAKELNVTRASLCMEKASQDVNNKIYVIGNAPTALIRLCELIDTGNVKPSLVVGVPVGFVNVVESKELLKKVNVPFILSEGRKGGSNIAAAIVNAILYMMKEKRV